MLCLPPQCCACPLNAVFTSLYSTDADPPIKPVPTSPQFIIITHHTATVVASYVVYSYCVMSACVTVYALYRPKPTAYLIRYKSKAYEQSFDYLTTLATRNC